MRVLYICTHNRCRSIVSEAITNQLASDVIIAKSAVSQPAGVLHPLSLKYLEKKGIRQPLYTVNLGMILLGVAPCTAMVFVWSQMTNGDANYTLVQVSINDIIMIFAFAPIAGLLLGVTDITVPWDTLLLSVVLYVLVPLLSGALIRKLLSNSGDHSTVDALLSSMKPWSIVGLLATITLLLGFQADTILTKPEAIVLIAIPLLLQTYGIFPLLIGWQNA